MRRAGGDVVAVAGEGADRTSGEAWPRDAGLAGACRRAKLGDRKALGEGERAAVAAPQADDGMDQQAERRDMHRLRPSRPALKRLVRRAAERIERARVEPGRQRVDDASTPAVERIGGAVLRLRRCRERRPAAPLGKADECDRRDVGELAFSLVVVEREGAVRSETALFDRTDDLRPGLHRASFFARSVSAGRAATQSCRCDDNRATRRSSRQRRSRRAPAG